MPQPSRFPVPEESAPTGRYRKRDRVVTIGEYRRVYGRGFHASGPAFGCYALPRRDGRSRLGISVSRKFGNSPERNRLKRIVREAFRRTRDALPEPCDVILVARRGAHGMTMPDAARDLLALVERALQRRERRARPARKRGRGKQAPKPSP